MSRFADPTLATVVDLGRCECPGVPHLEGDWARVRSQLSAHEIARWASASGEELGDEAAALVLEWNLLNPKGEAMPVTGAAILSLMAPTVSLLTDAIAAAIAASVTPPNASSAPSASGSPASASLSPSPA